MGRGEGRWGRRKPGVRRGTGVEVGGGRGGRGRGAGADAGQLPGSGSRAPPPRGGSRRLLPCMVRGRGPPRQPRPDRKPPSLPSRSLLPPCLGRETASFHDSELSQDSAIPILPNPDRPRFWYSRFKGPGKPESTVLRFFFFFTLFFFIYFYSSAIYFIHLFLQFCDYVLVLGLQKTKSEIPVLRF